MSNPCSLFFESFFLSRITQQSNLAFSSFCSLLSPPSLVKDFVMNLCCNFRETRALLVNFPPVTSNFCLLGDTITLKGASLNSASLYLVTNSFSPSVLSLMRL